jgi:pantoate--beta-alanine ligase
LRALESCKKRVAAGERDAMKLSGEMAGMIEKEPDAEIDYVALVDAETLDDLHTLSGEVLVALAVKIGNTRLIDNVRISLPKP